MIIAVISDSHKKDLIQTAFECHANAVRMILPERISSEQLIELREEAGLLELKLIIDICNFNTIQPVIDSKIEIVKVESTVPLELIEEIAKTKIPIIFSTGSTPLSGILETIETIRKYHNNLCLLKCTNGYTCPTHLKDMNLLTIPDMLHKFNCPVGLGDNTTGTISALIATLLGATVIEKPLLSPHISVSEEVFKGMVNAIKSLPKILGEVTYGSK